MESDAVIVGGGMAGLTAAAYLCRSGCKVALLEKEAKTGGLVTSFERGGFVFDGGIRAIENSGIVLPMLRQLGLELDFLPSPVSVGIGRDVVRLSSASSLEDYRALLERQFPESREDIAAIVAELRRIMGYLDVLYGIDNPLFLDSMMDPVYLRRTLLPWLFRYLGTMPKVSRLYGPVEGHLARLTGNQALIDLLAQHFFRKTPAYFALSYFSLYLDYRYPRGGTGSLSRCLEDYVRARGGEVLMGVEVAKVDSAQGRLLDREGREYRFRRLIWAADARSLYARLAPEALARGRAARRVAHQARAIEGAKGGDSVFTLYLSLDLEPSRIGKVASAHFFWTPATTGLSTIAPGDPLLPGGSEGLGAGDKEALFAWLERFLELTTYEISCPVLRDPELAPPGKTGLIVSTLMDYGFVKRLEDSGWLAEARKLCADHMVKVLDEGIFPGLAEALIDSFTSTPLSIEKATGNSGGAITGWAFSNPEIPAVRRLPAVATSVLTPIPGVYQAGQWSFSPSGLPISILTGKLAADRVIKDLRRRASLPRQGR